MSPPLDLQYLKDAVEAVRDGEPMAEDTYEGLLAALDEVGKLQADVALFRRAQEVTGRHTDQLLAEVATLRAVLAEAVTDTERAEEGMLEHARRANRALRRWKSVGTYAPDPVGTIIGYVDALRAEVERLRAEQKPTADRWAVYDPIEERYDFHGTGGSALQALEGIVDALRDRSSREVEGWDDNAEQAAMYALVRVAGLELRTVATAGDGTEEGEECSRKGWSHIAEAEIVQVGADGGKE